MERKTIAAIATPIGRGGIGIIKVSGPNAIAVANALFRSTLSKRSNHGFELETHHLYHGWIVDPKKNMPVDEVLIAIMLGPRSYTGEDVFEIQAHSGTAVLSEILALVLSQKVRHAEPGEFTKRAFLNGRIDLSQAEGVMDTIAAQSHQALKMATAQMAGGLQKSIHAIRNTLTDALVQIETAIDFIEDSDSDIVPDTLPEQLNQNVVMPLKALVDQYARSHLFREGVKMAVVGKPNVGKSSLLNGLIKKDRAIVTDIPGTTRDLIEESVIIKGIPIVVIDTAGLRNNGDAIEMMGIEKTHECIDQADLILFLLDATMVVDDNDRHIFTQIKDKNVIVVMNKIDLLIKGQTVMVPGDWMSFPRVAISALKWIGIDQLEHAIIRAVGQSNDPLGENPLVPNLRQKSAIQSAIAASSQLIKGLETGAPLEMVAIDTTEAINALGSITGETLTDTIIDQIFSRFCIGK